MALVCFVSILQEKITSLHLLGSNHLGALNLISE